jgi:hypothetical protein
MTIIISLIHTWVAGRLFGRGCGVEEIDVG